MIFLKERSFAADAIRPAIPSLEQQAIDVRSEKPHIVEIRQGDTIVTVLDVFVGDLVEALKRARARG